MGRNFLEEKMNEIIVKNIRKGTEVWNTPETFVRDYNDDIMDCLDEYACPPKGNLYMGEDCPECVKAYGIEFMKWIGNEDLEDFSHYPKLSELIDAVLADTYACIWLLNNMDRERRYEVFVNK
jgi:hypothetical protein